MAGKYSLVTLLTLDAAGYNKDLAKVNRDTKEYLNQVEGGVGKLKNFGGALVGMAGGFLAVNGAADFFKRSMKGSEASADDFERRMKGAEFASNEFFNRIATGNFENLLQGLKDAIELGKDYADQLDNIEDRRRSLTANEAIARNEMAKLNELYVDKNNTKDVRLKALSDMIVLEKKLGDTKKSIAEDEYKASLGVMLNKKEWTKQEQDDIERLLLTFDDAKDLREKAVQYNADVENSKASSFVPGQDNVRAIEESKRQSIERLKKVSEDERKAYELYFKTLQVYNTASGAEGAIDNWVKGFAELYNVATESQQAINTLTKKSSSLELGIGTEQEKINEKSEKELQTQQEIEDTLRKKWDYQKKYNAQMDILAQIVAKTTPTQTNKTVTTKWKPTIETASDEVMVRKSSSEEAIDAQIEAAKQQMQQFSNDINTILTQGVADGVGNIAEGIGNAIGGGGKVDWRGILLGGLITVAEQLGRMAIGIGMSILAIKKALQSLNPWVAIGAGIGLLALAGYAKSQMTKLSKFATGGIVGGGSYYGDKVPAMVNSGEMILNRSQQRNLFDMINGGSTMGGNELTTKVSGSDLMLVLSRTSQKTNSWR